MSEDLRSLREHLADERLYAGPPAPASAHPAAWHAELLARYPDRRRPQPTVSTTGLWRLILLVVLPLAVASTVALLAMVGVDFGLPSELQQWAGSAILAGAQRAPHALWYGLAALSAALTFIVRGRVPRLLPVNW
jgi:hypothetical protein